MIDAAESNLSKEIVFDGSYMMCDGELVNINSQELLVLDIIDETTMIVTLNFNPAIESMH